MQKEILLARHLLASAGSQEPKRLDRVLDQLQRLALRLRIAQLLLTESPDDLLLTREVVVDRARAQPALAIDVAMNVA